MADAIQALESLRRKIQVDRERQLEALADGRSEEKHWELVGRAKALKSVLEDIRAQIRSINGGEDDGDAKSA